MWFQLRNKSPVSKCSLFSIWNNSEAKGEMYDTSVQFSWNSISRRYLYTDIQTMRNLPWQGCIAGLQYLFLSWCGVEEFTTEKEW